jgi:hypothetical protein
LVLESFTKLDIYILKSEKTKGLALPFTLKSILRKKKNYENSNISPCKNIIFKRNLLKEIKTLRDVITL